MNRRARFYIFIIRIRTLARQQLFDFVLCVAHRSMWNLISLNRNYFIRRESSENLIHVASSSSYSALIDSIDQTLVTTILYGQYKLNHKESFFLIKPKHIVAAVCMCINLSGSIHRYVVQLNILIPTFDPSIPLHRNYYFTTKKFKNNGRFPDVVPHDKAKNMNVPSNQLSRIERFHLT